VRGVVAVASAALKEVGGGSEHEVDDGDSDARRQQDDPERRA
jgi:hypothetical protein